MKANHTEAKNPYVKFATYPNTGNKAEIIAMLKKAMQGQTITGATVLANADAYKAAWGDALYNKVLSADPASFSLTLSVGGEKNWGIDLNGKAGPTGGTLSAGVKTISIDGVEIAKVGTNWCFNALTPFPLTTAKPITPDVPAVDPDEFKPSGDTTRQLIAVPAGTGMLSLQITNNNYNYNNNTNNVPANSSGAALTGYASSGPSVQYAPQSQVVYQQPMQASYQEYPQEMYQMPRGRYVRGDHGWLFYASANAAGTFVGTTLSGLLERWIFGNGGSTTWNNNGGNTGGGGCLNCGGGPIHIGN